MTLVFDDTTRRKIAELCAGFARAGEDTALALKRAAVVIALTVVVMLLIEWLYGLERLLAGPGTR